MYYFPYNIGDFISATHHLDLEEEAIYRRLLDLYYLHEKPFFNDLGAISRQVRAKGREDLVKAILEEFFRLEGDLWIQTRCNEEIQKYRDKSEKAARSATARWSKSGSNADGMRSHSERKSDGMLTKNQEPRTNNQNSLSAITISPDLVLPDYIIKHVSESAMVPDKFVLECLVGFCAHFNGKEIGAVGLSDELVKWIDREWRFKK